MPTKYILNPDGTVTDGETLSSDIIRGERSLDLPGGAPSANEISPKVISKTQTNSSAAAKNLFYPYATDATEVLFTDSFLTGDNDRVRSKVTNSLDHNPSFDFVRDESERETIRSFKPCAVNLSFSS